MRNPFRDFFYFSREERRGIILLIAGIIFVFLCGYFYSYLRKEQPLSDEELRQQAIADREVKSFIASIQEMNRARKKEYYSYKQKQEICLNTFNPNTADSAALCKLGIPGWIARNIIHYRIKGGKFRRAEDFQKIYGLTKEQYQLLLPYIYIAPEDTARNDSCLYKKPVPKDKNSTDIPYKYPLGTAINLNRADTTELKKIPGIGSGIARMIVNYRQQLGGFYNIEQLQEIHLDYHQLEPWFQIDPNDIHPINVNRAGIERLQHHPYINFYQAKAFVEYRKKRGLLHNLKPFILYEEFSDTDLERISHYVCFE